MRCFLAVSLLLATASAIRADESTAIPSTAIPEYQNPRMSHVLVESWPPGEYMSINLGLCETADGRLLGVYHRTTEVDWAGSYDTYMRVSRDTGRTWSEAHLFLKNMQAPGLFKLSSGDILLWGSRLAKKEGRITGDPNKWPSSIMKLFRSKDDGHTWEEQAPIWEKSKGLRLQGGIVSMLQLKSGRLLLPIHGGDSGNSNSRFQAWCYYSDDDGKTWKEGKGKVSLPKRGAMSPMVAELKDGTLLMAMRTQLGSMHLSRSTDQGQTWSAAWSSGLEQPGSDSLLTVFPDTGDLLLLMMPAKYEPKHHHGGQRTPITAFVSKDEGKTWRRIGDIAGGNHEMCPVSVCFLSNGKVAITYEFCRVPWTRGRNGKGGGSWVAFADRKWFDPE